MCEIRYPVGVQSFSKIREEGFAYVDKTKYLPLLVNLNQYVFLSRPRRFGKSLLVSTLKAFFQGKRELFQGLAVEAEVREWSSYPVLHFDFNSGLYDAEDGLRVRMDTSLSLYEREYGIIPGDRTEVSIPTRFETLIRTVYESTGKRVVILIDEYDKPLLGLEENEQRFMQNQKILKSFYGNLKSMDEFIQFGFITGVARFNKVSIFSDLNNLDDISMDEKYADMCGWTEDELLNTFHDGIEALAIERGETPERTIDVLRGHYDGYLFTPKGSRLYNPYSVLRALKSKEVDPFWFDTGTPTFLVRRIRENRMDPAEFKDYKFTKRELIRVGMDSRNPIPLMFQTGYLTIDTYDAARQRFTLRFPNREVEYAFAEDLLPLYISDVKNNNSPFSIFKFQDDLYDGHPEAFMNRMATYFKGLPSEDQCESVYRAVVSLLCTLCSVDNHAELHSYKGRSDLEVSTPDYLYIFEFKYNHSASEAMEQLHSRDYAGRYALDSRTVYLIGANYDSSKENRGLTYEIECWHTATK